MDPLVELSECLFQASRGSDSSSARSRARALCQSEVLAGLCQRGAGLLLASAEELQALWAKRERRVGELRAAVEEAREKHGQVEVAEAQLRLAGFVARTGGREDAEKFFVAEGWDEGAVSVGKNIDVLFERIRIAIAWDDARAIKAHVLRAGKLLDVGGDWDRRNRLKVYHGLSHLMARDFHAVATEFLSCVATFTSEELFSYERFCTYTILACLVALQRVELKAKLVDSAEILAVMGAMANAGASAKQPTQDQVNVVVVGRLLAALYECRYRDFFVHLIDVATIMENDRYLSRHTRWFIREMRARAYSQYLASYRSVKLASMAATFGVSVAFMEGELARFIASKRIAAMVDNLAGVVETNRPDVLNAQYEVIIKQGDALLNRVQKLARAINV